MSEGGRKGRGKGRGRGRGGEYERGSERGGDGDNGRDSDRKRHRERGTVRSEEYTIHHLQLSIHESVNAAGSTTTTTIPPNKPNFISSYPSPQKR